MIDIRSIAVAHKPRLIGPTTSINGVYLGPFWYYFNLIPFVFSGGDPQIILFWQIIWYQLIGIFLFRSFGFFVSTFFLIMPLGFNTGRYSWNANAMPIFTALFLLLVYLVRNKQSAIRLLLLGLVAGLSFQIEAAFGIIFFPFSFLYLITFTRDLKAHLLHLVGFLVTLLPQAIFELRHQFPLTHTFISEISGKSDSLGMRLSFGERLSDRIAIFTKQTQEISHLPTTYLFPIFFIAVILTLIIIFKHRSSKPISNFFSLNLYFLIFAAIFYLLFPKPLKSWYLLGLSVPLIFLYTTSLLTISRRFATFILVISLFFTYLAQSDYLSVAKKMSSANKSSLSNELKAIDWVYANTNGEGFKAYSYLPSVYDYPYQYLFWSYGRTKYGYQPNDVAYLPNQPEYIENMTSFFDRIRPMAANEPTFLIIEEDNQNPQFLSAWLGNFAHLCQVSEKRFDFGTIVRKVERCK